MDGPDSVQLWIELGIAALMVPLSAFVHGAGLIGITKLFGLQEQSLKQRSLKFSSFYLVGVMGFALFAVHVVVIALYAGLYLALGASADLAEALFESFSAYTTVGTGLTEMPDEWKLLGGAEALVGLLLVGWSTAYLVRKMQTLRN